MKSGNILMVVDINVNVVVEIHSCAFNNIIAVIVVPRYRYTMRDVVCIVGSCRSQGNVQWSQEGGSCPHPVSFCQAEVATLWTT
jgi:hypothetical protein